MKMSKATAIRKTVREVGYDKTNKEIAKEVKGRYGVDVESSNIIGTIGAERNRLGRNANPSGSRSNWPLVPNNWAGTDTGEVSASSRGTGEIIHVPEGLLDLAESELKNRISIENRLLFWLIIDSWPYSDETGDDWKAIHSDRFGAVTTNSRAFAEIHRWLENKGFIKIKKIRLNDGREVNYYKDGEVSMSYKALCEGNLVPYELISKTYWGTIECHTDKHPLCQVTRQNVGLLAEVSREKLEYGSFDLEKKRKNKDSHSLYKLNTNKGRVNFGHKVKRLYSPWASARGDVRERFTLDGAPIVSWDLKASQPSLMAVMAEDWELLADCKSDALYQGIMHLLGVDRDTAKKAYMAYAYGKNRGDWAGHRDAYQVQEWMKRTYPKAGQFVRRHKKDNHYAKLSCELQDMEAEIFVFGALQEMSNLGLPALTVHDALYVREQDAEIAEQMARKNLDKIIPEEKYELERNPEHGPLPRRDTTI